MSGQVELNSLATDGPLDVALILACEATRQVWVMSFIHRSMFFLHFRHLSYFFSMLTFFNDDFPYWGYRFCVRRAKVAKPDPCVVARRASGAMDLIGDTTMKMKHFAMTTVIGVAITLPVWAHHNSPMEPDIGDAMGMHESAIENVEPSGSGASDMNGVAMDPADTDAGRPDGVGNNEVPEQEGTRGGVSQ